MDNPKVSNPNDFKVVQFHNKTDFAFTPEMGCMFDGRPISGITGAPGVSAGESLTLPYHIGHRLAINLAKIVKLRRAPLADEPNNPVGKPLWGEEDLENVKNSFLTDLYTEAKPTPVTETDRLMAKVEEYKKMVEQLLPPKTVPVVGSPESAPIVPESENGPSFVPAAESPTAFADKQDVIAELEKRGVKFDRRLSKASLEALLTV